MRPGTAYITEETSHCSNCRYDVLQPPFQRTASVRLGESFNLQQPHHLPLSTTPNNIGDPSNPLHHRAGHHRNRFAQSYPWPQIRVPNPNCNPPRSRHSTSNSTQTSQPTSLSNRSHSPKTSPNQRQARRILARRPRRLGPLASDNLRRKHGVAVLQEALAAPCQ